MESGTFYRTLGQTGERVSAIGLGGWQIGFPSQSESDSIALMRSAIDRGTTLTNWLADGPGSLQHRA